MASPSRFGSRIVPALLALPVSIGAAALGCGDEPSSDGGAGGSAAANGGWGGVDASLLPYEPCAVDAQVGRFEIELGDGFTRVGGEVSDAVLGSRVPAEVDAQGDCRLLQAVVTTCAPACPVASEACSPAGTCVALPRKRDVGTVTVRGLAVPLEMQPNAATRSYANPAQPMLPNPGFVPGADLRIASAGGDYAPFELRGWGISPLVLSGDVIDVRRGQPVRLGWAAPGEAGPARVNVELNINFHGSNSAWIECDFPDTGMGEIAASLVDGLFARGLSGNPTLTATRRSATSVEIEPGCVEMLVFSEVSTPVQVEGVVTCRTSSECPPPQMCLPVELFCQ
ncbi:MAG TPA: hypothetical protein VMG12_06270 [Polyangiaceae bacterium]|nr:hypothetical protein [Polyangiaceae bacterium]